MAFTLQLSRTAQKALDKLPTNAVKKIYAQVEGDVLKIAKIFQKKRKSDYR